MPKIGVANLPLHQGKAPRWLFKRMVLLSKNIVEVLSYEYGRDEFLYRISDPFWFQALSCVLGFDWHSSGTTTVTCGALKAALDPIEHGLAITGGKGRTSRKTLDEIEKISKNYGFSTARIEKLKYSSRMAAKIDNTALQDGHNLYHHVFLFSEDGLWSIIQQGMNSETNYARRYHWLSEKVENFICEPHSAILGERIQEKVLDMTAKESKAAQNVTLDLVNDKPSHLKKDWAELIRQQYQKTLDDWLIYKLNKKPFRYLTMPRNLNWEKMREIYDFQPKNYEELLSIKGVGPNTIRALALIADLIYGETPSWKDPIKYSFAIGGKDGVPFPVDKIAMDKSIEILKVCLQKAKIEKKEKIEALRRLYNVIPITK